MSDSFTRTSFLALVSALKNLRVQDLKIFRSILYLVLLAAFSPRAQSIAFNLTIVVFPFSLLVPMESVASTPAVAAGTSNILDGNFAFFAAAPNASAPDRKSTAASPDHQSRTRRRFERAIARVQPLLQRYGYGAAFAAVMVEGMGIPTPGQTLLMAGALEATGGRMNIVLLLFLVTIAATLGNSLGYAIGRWGGRVVLNKLRVNPQRQQYLEDLFHRRGGLVILLARFLDGLRQLNGIVAGVLRMPWWTFTAHNVAGALLWSCAWGLGTYYLGRDIHVIAAFFDRHRPLLLALGAAAFIALLAYLLRPRKVSSDQ